MRIVFALCAAALTGLVPVPAFAAEDTQSSSPPAISDNTSAEGAAHPKGVTEERQENRLDALFLQLKRERNEGAAERIAGRIGEAWSHSGSASIDLMMGWSKTAMDSKKFDVALDFLDQVVTMRPTYAEGWNRRATVHFAMENYAKSMADINRTLELEPRHFGALAGMGQIMKNTGRKELALQAWQRVLDIYPMMRSAQAEVATLSEELAGEGI
jgi:tetratricopeptide (TPR) repeat protein